MFFQIHSTLLRHSSSNYPTYFIYIFEYELFLSLLFFLVISSGFLRPSCALNHCFPPSLSIQHIFSQLCLNFHEQVLIHTFLLRIFCSSVVFYCHVVSRLRISTSFNPFFSLVEYLVLYFVSCFDLWLVSISLLASGYIYKFSLNTVYFPIVPNHYFTSPFRSYTTFQFPLFIVNSPFYLCLKPLILSISFLNWPFWPGICIGHDCGWTGAAPSVSNPCHHLLT